MLYFPHMAAKKTTLKELGEMIERGFAAVASDIADIKSTMATKDDIAAVNKTLDEHTKTLADHTKILNDHTRDLAVIKNDVTNNLDKRLQLEVRVSTIEKHLGLDKKIAA
jgi:septal ring factor EnvC (AmiA/AmiB activator)